MWGGGGSSSGATSLNFNSPGSTAFADFFPANRLSLGSTSTAEVFLSFRGAAAATAAPEHNGFSITQSSRPDLTLEGMTVSEDSLIVDTSLTASAFSSVTEMVEATPLTGGVSPYREYVLSQSEVGGQAAEMIGYVFSFNNGVDTDYLAFGSWFYDNDRAYSNANDDTVVGAFGGSSVTGVTSRRPSPSSLTTSPTATYRGDAFGHFFDDLTKPNAFHGKLALEAIFSGTPMVSGMISDINYVTDPTIPLANEITLGDATINTIGNTAGQFSGDTEYTLPSGTEFNGEWGGQFYGNEAQAVVGTFGVQILPNIGYVGSFGAKKQ